MGKNDESLGIGTLVDLELGFNLVYLLFLVLHYDVLETYTPAN